jgi:preprotein translocase subunit SecF
MELISSKARINFMGMRYVFFLVSLSIIAFSFFVWFSTGSEKYSVDFVGGTDVVVKFQQPIRIADVRKALIAGGIDGAIVQSFEEDTAEFSIRMKANQELDTGKRIQDALRAHVKGADEQGISFELLQQDFVGPIIGEQIRQDGIKAMLIALVCILIYISFRFEWRFALGAIAALVHDVMITTGLFVFSGHEISASVLAALLTIIGYSLNDTIIVFDRIRENLGLAIKDERKPKKKGSEDSIGLMSLSELINLSINQTLSRTILTSLTTLFVVTTLWMLGGGAVADLAFALVIGIVVGTYSSIFIASPLLLVLAAKPPSSDSAAAKKAA